MPNPSKDKEIEQVGEASFSHVTHRVSPNSKDLGNRVLLLHAIEFQQPSKQTDK